MSLIFDNIIYYSTQIIQMTIFLSGIYFFGITLLGWANWTKNSCAKQNSKQNKFALVIAAHNEELVIGNILDSLNQQNYPKNLYTIFVIADNCTDSTALIAKRHGANVFERSNNKKKGKGYALEWMFNKLFLMNDNFDAISVFDADNLVTSDFLTEMNEKLCEGNQVVQGYIDSKNPYDSWITCSYSIAFWLANRIFQLPRYNLGLSCGLCGTGFSIDSNVLKKIGWGATCLTEDLEFTMKLALNNLKVAWAHKAVVYDEKPITLKQSWNQRKRWMQGHADCAGKYLKPLFYKGIKERDMVAFDCAIYLFQPIRFIFLGLITLMMWIQTIYPESPFYNLKYLFPVQVWYIFVTLQMFYGPLIILIEKKFNLKSLLGFIIYPFYCLTWVPITIQGFLSKDNKEWDHTLHTRKISIKDLEEA